MGNGLTRLTRIAQESLTQWFSDRKPASRKSSLRGCGLCSSSWMPPLGIWNSKTERARSHFLPVHKSVAAAGSMAQCRCPWGKALPEHRLQRPVCPGTQQESQSRPGGPGCSIRSQHFTKQERGSWQMPHCSCKSLQEGIVHSTHSQLSSIPMLSSYTSVLPQTLGAVLKELDFPKMHGMHSLELDLFCPVPLARFWRSRETQVNTNSGCIYIYLAFETFSAGASKGRQIMIFPMWTSVESSELWFFGDLIRYNLLLCAFSIQNS